MKRFLLIVLTLATLVSLFGCNTSEENSIPNNSIEVSEEESMAELIVPPFTKEEIAAHKELPIWPEGNVPYTMDETVPTVVPYLVENAKGCIMVLPGGGYFQRTDKEEGSMVAEEYNKQGYSAFVVHYRYKPYSGDAILADANRAIQYVRYYSDAFGIDDDKIAVIGFSAGGHLAVMTCQHDSDYKIDDAISKESSFPNACMLLYAVTTLGDGTFMGAGNSSMPEIFLGENKDNKNLIDKYSYYNDINAMPDTFIAYTNKDTFVDFEKNSIALADALEDAGKKVVIKEYTDGTHGLGIGAVYADYSKWFGESITFLGESFK